MLTDNRMIASVGNSGTAGVGVGVEVVDVAVELAAGFGFAVADVAGTYSIAKAP